MRSTYLRLELRRTFRNRRFLLFSLGFPLVLYFLIAGPSRGEHDLGGTGISAPLYYMVGLISFGTMTAMLSTGARIAAERAVGWNRQLRISPLSSLEYFRTKLVTAYALAATSIGLLFLSGALLGVRMPAARWVEMTVLLVVGLVPFAALGITLGHLVTPDSTGPMVGGITALLAFVSGTWFPIGSHGVVHDIAQFLPSYWLVQAGHIGIGGHPWGATAWAVVAAWAVVLTATARWAYRRDTQRQ
jgi:ABC-2 type transport system permease protein